MDWIQVKRVTHNSGTVILLAVAVISLVYFGGYPWTCQQAMKVQSLASLRLRRAQNEYPPNAPYRRFREAGQREADARVNAMCQMDNALSESDHKNLKFFIKYRSDY